MAKILCLKDTETGQVDELCIDSTNGYTVLKKITINEAVQKYLTECTAYKSIPSQRLEKKYFPIFLEHLEQFNLKYVHEITVEHIDAFQNELLEKMSPQSVRKRLSTFKHFMNKCIHWNHIYKSPFLGIRCLRIEKNPRKTWTREIYLKFLSVISEDAKCIFEFLWLTGCRPTELINLKWTDIDYDRKLITFRCGKNAHITRKIKMCNSTENVLHRVKMKGNEVFKISDKPLTNDTLSHYARKWLRRLGYNDLVVYGIRHSFASRMSDSGLFNAFDIKEMMGHSDIKTTLNYIHIDENILIEKLNRVNSA